MATRTNRKIHFGMGIVYAAEETRADAAEIRRAVEGANEATRLHGLRAALAWLSAHPGPSTAATSLLVAVVRAVLPNQRNKRTKKIALLAVEAVPKRDAEGRVLPEVILLCNALRGDLTHASEHVRAHALRFVADIAEAEVLEPLVPSIRTCLTDAHAFVRRAASGALAAVYATGHEALVPDAPEVLSALLATDGDAGVRAACLRGLLDMSALDVASEALDAALPRLTTEAGQLAAVDYVRRVGGDASFVQAYAFESAFPSVRWAAAQLLLSRGATSAAAEALVGLAAESSDASCAALDALFPIAERIESSGVAALLSLLRTTPDEDAKARALRVVTAAADASTAADAAAAAVGEMRTAVGASYRAALSSALSSLCARHSCAASAAASALVDVLADPKDTPTDALDGAAAALRTSVARSSAVRASVLPSLVSRVLPVLGAPSALCTVLWLIGLYGDAGMLEGVSSAVGPLPLVPSAGSSAEKKTQRTAVRPDGTYGVSETAGSSELRAQLLKGDAGVILALATAVARLVIGDTAKGGSKRKASGLLLISALVRLSLLVSAPRDVFDALVSLLSMSAGDVPAGASALLSPCRSALLARIDSAQSAGQASSLLADAVDAPVRFGCAAPASSPGGLATAAERSDRADVERALSGASADAAALSRLARVVQLTGFADEVYAEAGVEVAGADVVLEVRLVSQVPETLHSVALELAADGGLSIPCDGRPPAPVALAPGATATVRASARAVSTADGTICGAITYSTGAGGTEPQAIVIEPVSVSAGEFLRPGDLSASAFRALWLRLEWENKIVVAPISVPAGRAGDALSAIVSTISAASGLRCVTPRAGVSSSGAYAAANLCARSIFSEDILANVSLALGAAAGGDGARTASGHMRLRASTHAVAVALGERVSSALAALASSGL